MSLTFANFKSVIPSHILTRGRSYNNPRHLRDLSFDEEEMVWTAQIQGTELYDVEIILNQDATLRCACTCPYDMGEYCKHVAAVLYAIEEAFPDQLGVEPRKKAGKRKSRHDLLKERLEKAPREQLVSILLNLGGSNREILNQLLVHLDAGDGKPMDYRWLVKDALKAGNPDHGYLDYTGSTRAGRKVGGLLDQADQWRSEGETGKAVAMALAVLDEVMPAIQQADDSNGGLGACIARAIEALEEAGPALDEAGQEALFGQVLERAKQIRYDGWDWEWDLLSVAEALVTTPERRAAFDAMLDASEVSIRKRSGHSYSGDYEHEQIVRFRLGMIERFDGVEAAERYLLTLLHIHSFRMEWIERCLHAGDYEEANRWIEAGVKAGTASRYPGQLTEYQSLQLKLRQQTGDSKGALQTARALWLQDGKQEHYVLLQTLTPASEWDEFVNRLIKEIEPPLQLAWVYARENRWDELMTFAESRQAGSWVIEEYRSMLERRYPERMAVLYEARALKIMAMADSREGYRDAVQYLSRMKELGQANRVKTIIEHLRSQYPKRRALLEELDKV